MSISWLKPDDDGYTKIRSGAAIDQMPISWRDTMLSAESSWKRQAILHSSGPDSMGANIANTHWLCLSSIAVKLLYCAARLDTLTCKMKNLSYSSCRSIPPYGVMNAQAHP
jgi:hypothetical protein